MSYIPGLMMLFRRKTPIPMRANSMSLKTATAIKFILACLALAGMTIAFSGCASESTDTMPKYEGWQTYSYRHFVFHFPEGSYWGRNIESFSNAMERYLIEDCEFMAMEVPDDTIHFYIHNNPVEAKTLTGRDVPFHTENQIHWGRRTAFGLQLARFLIDKWGIRRTDFHVLYDGLATLRDYSDLDYHHITSALVEAGQFIPLDSLIDNDAYLRQDTIYRVQEAASLVAFLTYYFGINRFKMLWQSAASFEESVQNLFDIDVKALENGWLKFAKQFYQGINRRNLMPDSTANDKREDI